MFSAATPGGGVGADGRPYGDADLNTLYLGSGGGSGGNAKDLTTNPKGIFFFSFPLHRQPTLKV